MKEVDLPFQICHSCPAAKGEIFHFEKYKGLNGVMLVCTEKKRLLGRGNKVTMSFVPVVGDIRLFKSKKLEEDLRRIEDVTDECLVLKTGRSVNTSSNI